MISVTAGPAPGKEGLLIKEVASRIEQNLEQMIEKSIESSVFQSISLQGVLLSKYYDIHSRQVVLPRQGDLIGKGLINKLKFISLMNFRRILNTIEGVNEEYLDLLTLFNVPEQAMKQDFDLVNLVNLGGKSTFLQEINIDDAQYESFKNLTIGTFLKYISRVNSSLLITDFYDESANQRGSRL